MGELDHVERVVQEDRSVLIGVNNNFQLMKVGRLTFWKSANKFN